MEMQVTSETITVSGTDNLEILKPVSSEMPVKVEKSESIVKTSEDLNGPVDVNLLGLSHQVIHLRILSWPKTDRAVPLDRIDRILSQLLDHFLNVNHSQRTGL